MSRRLPLTDVERASVARTVELYAAVVYDLRDVLQNGWPSPEELPEAPVLDAWVLSQRAVPNLQGRAVDHPVLSGDWTHTSPLHAISVAAGVARTQSRWYRLGEPLVRLDEEKILPTCEVR